MNAEEEKNPRQTAYKLAAYLLHDDLYKVSAAVVICSLPRMLALLATGIDSPNFWLMLTIRILELFFLYQICTSHINKFRSPSSESNTLLQLLLFGILYWLIVRSPIVAITAIAEPNTAATAAAILIIPAIVFGILYFFYFFPFCAGVKEHRLAASEARWITKKDPYAPLRALITPIAIYFLLRNLVLLGSPDGRELYTVFLDCFISEVPFFLSTYISIGLCLYLIEGKKWHDYGFDPYREARFETLASQAPEVLAKILSPRKGVLILFISAFIGYANLMQVYDMPPSPKFKITTKAISDSSILLELSLTDEKYRFRGFQPHAFKIAGPKGTSIHEKPPRIKFEPDEAYKSAKLSLTFDTKMKAEEIKQLEDLHLWYFNTKLDQLEEFSATTKTQT